MAAVNPPPINQGWGDDPKRGPSLPWSIWFQNIWPQFGVWTPAPFSSGGSSTYTVQNCAFVRMGNQITVSFDITCTNAGTGTGDIMIPLPPDYTVPAQNGSSAVREQAVNGFTACAQVFVGSSVIQLSRYDNANLPVTNGHWAGSVSYFI